MVGIRQLPRRWQGLTLIELLVSIAVLGVLLTIAAPSFFGFVDRTRFTSGVDEIAAALHLVRSEGLRNNQLAVVHAKGGTSWCLGSRLTTTNETCDCSTTAVGSACGLKRLTSSDSGGINQLTLRDQTGTTANDLYYFFDASRGVAATPSGVSSSTALVVTARSSGGREAQVRLTATGMVSVCATSGGGLSSVYPAC